MGRPTKFNADIAKRILAYIRAGSPVETAYLSADIAKSTMQQWMKKGAPGKKGPFAEFAADVEKALADHENNCVLQLAQLSRKRIEHKFECDECGHENTVSIAVPGNVQLEALKWNLSKRHPENWGNKTTIKVEGAEAIADGFEKVQDAMARKKKRE